jgi:peptidoglycan hydrolase-like protein with peptidoglycan-binding domain
MLLKKRVWIEILSVLCAGALLLAATPATTATAKKKKSSSKAGTNTSAKKTTATSKRRSTSRKPKVASWRNNQHSPSPERYKEIQDALASKGYLQPDTASGVWDTSSMSALKKFQQDQNLEPSGKLDSVSIIALGLGPKRDQAPAPHP